MAGFFGIGVILGIYPFLWLCLGVFISRTMEKKGYFFGLKRTEEEQADEEVRLLAARCRRSLILLSLPLTLVLFPFVLLPWRSVLIFFLLLWFLAAISLPLLVFRRYYCRLKALKLAKGWSVDEEADFWLLGMFYCRPEDARDFVPKRMGSGLTLNWAHRRGKILRVWLACCLLALPLFGAALVIEDFTPLKIILDDTGLEVRQLSREFFIPYDEVETVSLLTETPVSFPTVASLTYIDKGTVKLPGYGSCRFCLDCRDPFLLMLKTAEETYFISLDCRGQGEKIIDAIPMER